MVGSDDKRVAAGEINIHLGRISGCSPARCKTRRTSRAGGGIEGRGPERRSAIRF